VLEQFNAPSTSTSKPATQSKQKEPSVKDEEIDEEDFAKQFAAEMEAFMKGLVDPGSKPSAEPVDPEAAKQAEALRKAWEQLLVEDLEGEEEDALMATPAVASGSKPKPKSTESSKEPTSKVEDEFQNAVKQAMEKLKESDDSSKVRNFSVT
jgi:peroxin-19